MEKKTIKKKIISVSTAIAVMLNLPFALDLTVKAMGIVGSNVHTNHKVCENCAEGSHACSHEGVEWQKWTDTTTLPAEGKWYLDVDVTVAAKTKVEDGNELFLCLNGHTVDMDDSFTGSIFIIGDGSILNLSDCSTEQTGTLKGREGNGKSVVEFAYSARNRDAKFNMYGGTITGNGRSGSGGGVLLQCGTFTMVGGAIKGNTAGNTGGGVEVSTNGTFIMEGGTISYNYAESGAGVCITANNSGSFTMKGGMISYNGVSGDGTRAKYGGGVYIYDGKHFTMEGGLISHNEACFGGGVSTEYTYNGAKFTMTGGIISQNTAKNKEEVGGLGGGLFMKSNAKFQMSGGTISGNTASKQGGGISNGYGAEITVDNKVYIAANTLGDSTNNVYLGSNKKFNIGANFDPDSKIGVNFIGADDNTSPASCDGPVTISFPASDVCGAFFTDSADYQIVYTDADDSSDKVIKLTKHTPSNYSSQDDYHHSFDCTGCSSSVTAAHSWIVNDEIQQTNPSLTETGIRGIKCTVCGFEKEEVIPELSNDDVWTNADTGSKNLYRSDIFGQVSIASDDDQGGGNDDQGGDNDNPPADNDDSDDQPPSDTPDDSTSEDTDSTPAATVPTAESEPTESDFYPNIDLGNVEKEVEQKENVPTANIATPIKDLLQAIMPTEELEAIKDTDTIKIVLKVEDATETVSPEDKQQVEAALQENSDYVLSQYLDLSLLKIINDNETRITKTNAPVTVTFEVPEESRKENRKFAAISVNDGKTEILNDLDEEPDTVTIKTVEFHIVALAYADIEVNPNTGAYVSIIPLAIAAVSISALTIRKKSKQK